jgi:MFS family permease
MAVAPWFRTTVRGLPRTFWFLWLGTLINRVGIFVVPFLVLFLTKQRAFSIIEASFVVSLFGVGSFIAQILGGITSDRFGRRPTMLLSFFGSSVILLILSQTHGFWPIALVTLLLGATTDLYRPASSAVIADVVGRDDRVRAYNLRYWAINLGAAIGFALAGFLAERNYLYLFIWDAITTAAFGLIVLFFIPETAPPRHSAPTDASMPRPSLRELWREERAVFNFTVLFALLWVGVSAVYDQSHVTMPLAMAADGFSEAVYGLVAAINGVVIILITLSLNQALARYSRFVVLAGGTALIGVGFGLYAITDSLWLYAVGVVLWTVGELVTSPLTPALIADISPPARRGFYQGMMGASYGVAAFVGPNAGAWVYSHWGNSALWLWCMAVALLMALGFLWILQPFYDKIKQVG